MAYHRLRAGALQQTPDINEYLNAANEAYTQPLVASPQTPPPTFPDGLTILKNGKGQYVYKYIPEDGFYAVAFKTQENQVVVAFEGTNFFTGSAQFTAGQVVADAQITAGEAPTAFADALAFTKTAIRAAGAARNKIMPRNVFLGGHSLGAAEAEYVASRTGMGGTTFGTPGIVVTGTPAKSPLVDYVEYGDPVGNYANETASPISNIVASISPTSKHFGAVNYVGSTSYYMKIDEFPYYAPSYYTDLNLASGFYAGGTEDDVGAAAAALAAAVPAHFLSQYAMDIPGAMPLGDLDHSFGANPLCFAQGTRLATPRGDVPVEALAVGDIVVTAGGARRAIRWLGRRTIAATGRPVPWNSRPVRILAGAFGGGLPVRDLLLSPGHPVLVGADADGDGGVLVPIMCLVNGTTIDRVAVESITYWHVELAAHDILLAEGLPAESYLECGDRAFFGGAENPLADPDLVVPGLGARCRPVAIDGAMVEAERRRLDAVFAVRLAVACAWPDAIASA